MINDSDVFGLLKTSVDAHNLGISTIKMFIEQSGYQVILSSTEVSQAMTGIGKINNDSQIVRWIKDNNINILSFSYRLDPKDGCDYFIRLYNLLKGNKLLAEDGGIIKVVSVAALPDTCELIRQQLGGRVLYFPGNETAIESLARYGVPESRYPKSFAYQHQYDKSLYDFATEFITSAKYNEVTVPDHYGYTDCGTDKDTYLKRLDYCRKHHSLPIIRLHAGPYSPDRLDAVKQFKSWAKELADSRLLDVLSIGSSQLTQSNFSENWDGLANGGGVPINSEIEYREIAQAARPMLVRTYAGTKNVPWMAQMHERTLNISWHALSFWWFCELDGRGNNDLLTNLREHIETVRYIASTGKPLEPNVSHHFSFRGGDDVTYIVSAYLAAKTAKINGIKHLIVQNMLNTPKYTWGIEDLAKGRALLRIIRELEDSTFSISLQTRAGLEYFSTDLDVAKTQLAAVTAMMDDIEPDNPNSPEIIHVVSYSEAVRLANPDIMKESIKITLGALRQYRLKKSLGQTYDTIHNAEINSRFNNLYEQAKTAISILEQRYPNLYTAEGLYQAFVDGCLPVPYLLDVNDKYPHAKQWQTTIIDGAVVTVDDKNRPVNAAQRLN